jgi:hypothetical protein
MIDETILVVVFYVKYSRPLRELCDIFQTEGPQIHLIYEECMRVYKYYLNLFVIDQIMKWENDMLISLDFGNSNNFISDTEFKKRVFFEINFPGYNIDEQTVQISGDHLQKFRAFIIKIPQLMLKYLPLKEERSKLLACLDPKVRMSFWEFKKVVYSFSFLIQSGREEQIISEFTKYRYMEDYRLPSTTSGLDKFWGSVSRDDSLKLNDLSHFMIKLMLIPHSTASVERLFSSLKDTKNYKRNRLGEKSLNSLLLVDSYYNSYEREGVEYNPRIIDGSSLNQILEEEDIDIEI